MALYNIHRSTTPGFQPSAANRVGQATATTFTNTGVAAGTYYYVVTAQDVAGNVSDPSNEVLVFVFADTTPPTVAITAPVDRPPVSGSITVSATASDDVGVASVQFKLDGSPLGGPTHGTAVLDHVGQRHDLERLAHADRRRARRGGQHVRGQRDVTVSNTSRDAERAGRGVRVQRRQAACSR